MFSTCRSLQTGLILLALGGCSKEPTAPQSAPLAPAITQTNDVTANARTLSGSINAAGIAATYEATFEEQERLRIAEQRADSRKGEYEFRGARLLHYSGGGLSERGRDRVALQSAGSAGAREVGQRRHCAAGRNQRDPRARAVTAQSCARAENHSRPSLSAPAARSRRAGRRAYCAPARCRRRARRCAP